MHALLDCINEASMLSSHAYGVIQSSYRISPRLPSCLSNPTLNFFATWDKLCATKLHPFLYPWTFLEAKRSKQRIYFSFWPIVEPPSDATSLFIEHFTHSTPRISPLLLRRCSVWFRSHHTGEPAAAWFVASRLLLLGPSWFLNAGRPVELGFPQLLTRNLNTMPLALFDV